MLVEVNVMFLHFQEWTAVWMTYTTVCTAAVSQFLTWLRNHQPAGNF